MIKRAFFSLRGPKLKYLPVLDRLVVPRQVDLPSKVTLLAADCDMGAIDLKLGTLVNTGERLKISDGGYIVSTVTGTISAIDEFTGYLGRSYVSISIEVSGEDQWDGAMLEALAEPSVEGALDYLDAIPGKANFSSLLRLQPPVNTIVVNGLDQDLLVLTNQQMVQSEGLSEGVEYLKRLTRTGRVILAIFSDSSLSELAGVEIRRIRSVYPHPVAAMIAKEVLGSGYVSGGGFDEMGIGFVGVEALLALSELFGEGRFSVDKVLTVIGKDNEAELVKARIGTPVGDILDFLGIEASHGDRLVFGGPMMGQAIYSLDMPILWDTDAVMVQDRSQVVLSEDVQCINCGECVRACPVGVPVNMLVRVLGSSLYEEAVASYDLLSCIECGLCSYVCVARIPIFHHIMLGKQEFYGLKNAEGSNA